MLTVGAVVVAALIVKPLMRVFADLIPAGAQFRLTVATLLFLLMVIVVTTLLAGFYPAKVLGNYQPTVTLKGITAVPGSAKGTLRRGLIVFQFTISLLFIIASVVIGAQLRYVLHENLGFNTDAIVTLGAARDNTLANSSFGSDKNRARQRSSDEMIRTAVLVQKIRQLGWCRTGDQGVEIADGQVAYRIRRWRSQGK